jgi:hypothetical protein
MSWAAPSQFLIKIMVSSSVCSYRPPMAHILFRCPYTALNVQYSLSDDASQRDDESTYEAVTCPACSRLHFVNRSTGKLLGDHKKT